MSSRKDNAYQRSADMEKPPVSTWGILISMAVIALMVFWTMPKPWVQIGAGERGVLLQWKAVKGTVLGEGLHFIIPVMHTVAIMDVTIQKSRTEVTVVSEDMKEARTVVAVNYHMDPLKADVVYRNLGPEWERRLVAPAAREAVRAVSIRYRAEELIAKSGQVRVETLQFLKDVLNYYHIIVDDLEIQVEDKWKPHEMKDY